MLRVTAALEFGKVWVNCHLEVASEMPNTAAMLSSVSPTATVWVRPAGRAMLSPAGSPSPLKDTDGLAVMMTGSPYFRWC